MVCGNCGKESNNLRVCPFCHTPYAPEPAPRASQRVSTQTNPALQNIPQTSRRSTPGMAAMAESEKPPFFASARSRIMVWSAVGVFALAVGGLFVLYRERPIPNGVVLPNIILAPMTAAEADVIVRRIAETGKVDASGAEVAVHFPAATFPLHRDGQLALAQQYARADEIVEGRKRPIAFYDPDGRVFARASGGGVMMVR